MTLRDPQGRFIRATPEQRVAAHVERLNERHPEQDDNPNGYLGSAQNLAYAAWNLSRAQYYAELAERQSQFPGENTNWKDQAANEVFANLPKDQSSFRDAYTVFSEPKRSQPIEYEDDNSRWPWVSGFGVTVFVLFTAIWVMTH